MTASSSGDRFKSAPRFSQSTFFHVGIYIGNGQMIHAPRTGDVVKISSVTWTRVLGVGRPK
ncbi:MAG: hypothetical protein EBV80_05565 [Acidimicrobiia bacterium]|nr:hypothetical protein [Acidimicrobiia bacterium]